MSTKKKAKTAAKKATTKKKSVAKKATTKKKVAKKAATKTSAVKKAPAQKTTADANAVAPKKVRAKRTTKAERLEQEHQEKLNRKWHTLKVKEDIVVGKYNMKNTYEPRTAIDHKVLGWGYIISNVNNRLEVLFESGVKFLISDYKS